LAFPGPARAGPVFFLFVAVVPEGRIRRSQQLTRISHTVLWCRGTISQIPSSSGNILPFPFVVPASCRLLYLSAPYPCGSSAARVRGPRTFNCKLSTVDRVHGENDTARGALPLRTLPDAQDATAKAIRRPVRYACLYGRSRKHGSTEKDTYRVFAPETQSSLFPSF
jgi:hypothetical protein